MTDQSLFEEKKEDEVTPQDKPDQFAKYADLLASIKNDNGEQKYKTLDDALVALQHSQKYIPELKQADQEKERQLAELKEKLAKVESLEEIVSRLQKKENGQEGATPPTPAGLDEQAARKLFDSVLTERERAVLEKQNHDRVQKALLDKFGEKAIEHIQAVAAKYGKSPQDFGALAKQSPDIALALLIPEGVNSPKPTVNSRNTAAMKPTESSVLDQAKGLLGKAGSSEMTDIVARLRAEKYAKYGISN